MLRSFHLLHQLAKQFELTAVIRQDDAELKKASELYPALQKVKFYSSKSHVRIKQAANQITSRIGNKIKFHWLTKSIKGKTDSVFLDYYPALHEALRQKKYDIIVLEGLSTLNAMPVIRKYARNSVIVYNAHNVDSSLASQNGNKYHSIILNSEKKIYKSADAILACSQKDLNELLQLNSHKLKGTVIPNGVEIKNNSVLKSFNENMSTLLFCGSINYEPNIEGLLWFYDSVWPKLKKEIPQIEFYIVGNGQVTSKLMALQNDPQIVFTGKVESVEPYYEKASLAIVPLLTGSGTRLKVLEAMGMGVPVLSTTLGAEGIDYTDNKNIFIVDEPDLFSEKITDILHNPLQAEAVKQSAYKLAVDVYNWDVVGKKLCNYLNNFKK